jgi:hypothetical protein
MTHNQVPQRVIIGAGEKCVSVDLFLKSSVLAGDFTKLSTHHQPLTFSVKHTNSFTHPLQIMRYTHDID